MKIAMLINSFGRGGQERQLIELLKSMQSEKNIEIEVLTFSKKMDYPDVLDLGYPVHILERKPKMDPRVFYKVYRILKRFQPDLVHSWGAMASIYGAPVSQWLGIKFINQNVMDAAPNLSWTDIQYSKVCLSFPFSEIIISNSEAGLDAYDVPDKKRKYIYNGFDLNRGKNLEKPSTVRQQLGITTPKVVGMVGAFQDRKDYNTYLKGAIQVVQNHKDVTFLAIGGGKNLERCKAIVPKELQQQIIFTGMLSNVESVIQLFDVAVLCTNTKVHQEGISNSILEYLFFKKPVVATRGGGTNEIVFPNKTGLLVNPFDVNELVGAIQRLLDDRSFSKELGQNGHNLVKTQFSLERMREDYLELYANSEG